MTSRLKTNFAVQSKFEPFYVSGKIAVSRNGQQIFSYCGDSIKVLTISTGRVEKTLRLDDDADQITAFALNPKTETIATASRSLLIREWDVSSGTCSRSWKAVHHAPIVSMNFDSTGDLLATGSGDSTVKIWHTVLKCHTHSFRGSSGAVSLVKFHTDPTRGQLYSAADDYSIRVWNLNPARQNAAMEGHFSAVTDMQLTDDGNQLLSSGRDKVIIVWDTRTFNQIKTVPIFEEVERLVVLPSQDFPEFNAVKGQLNVLTGGTGGKLSVWNLSTNRNIYPGVAPDKEEVPEHHKITQLHYVENLRRLFVVLTDQSVLIYNLPNLKAKHQFSGYNDEILDVKFIGNDAFALLATNSPRLKVYNLKTADCKFGDGHLDSVLCIAVSERDGLFATGSKDADIRLWRFSETKGSVKSVAFATGHTSAVGAVAFSRSTKRSFVVSGSEDLTLKIWNVMETNNDNHSVYSLEAVRTEVAHEKGIEYVTVSPDDKWIASASSDKTAKIWKAEPFGLKGVLRGHRRAVWCVQFAPHDQIIGTCSGDGTIKLWSLADTRCVKTFEGHDCSVMKLSFLSRGLQILSSASDGLLKLWDVRKNICAKTFDEHDDKVWALEVSRDEGQILTGASDSTFLLWKDMTAEEEDEEKRKSDTLILQDQEMSNLLEEKQYGKAFRLALTLDQPNRLLNFVNEMVNSPAGREDITTIIRKLDDFLLEQLLKYVVAWNTNSRHTFPAQYVLGCVFRNVHPKRLLALPKIRIYVEGLIPYTERHATRLDQLHVSSMFFGYLWNNVKQLHEIPSSSVTALPHMVLAASSDMEIVE